jgi:RNA polymerase-binding transcription factor DksA
MQSLQLDCSRAEDIARASFLNRFPTMTALATVSKERQELVETEAALARIEEGRFGRCDGCGGAIGRQRLLALPAVRLCIECTSKMRVAG